MSNKKRVNVTARFKGKNLKLCLTFNSFCELEDHYGQNITQIFTKYLNDFAAQSVSMRDSRAVLWASMLETLPDASLRDAGELGEQLGQEKLSEVVAEVMANSGLFGEVGEDPEKPSGKPRGKKPSTA